MSEQGPVDAVTVELPPTWSQVKTTRAAIEELANQALSSMKKQGFKLEAFERRRMEASFGRLHAAVQLSGVSSLGLFVDFVSSDEPAAEPILEVLYATCAIRNITQSDLQTELPLAPEVLMAALTQGKSPGNLLTNRHQYIALEEPAIVDLPAGKALLLRELLEYKKNLAEVINLYTQTYFVPQDTSFDTLTIVQLSTPNVELSRDFSGVFHSIARSLTFVREGDPSLVIDLETEQAVQPQV